MQESAWLWAAAATDCSDWDDVKIAAAAALHQIYKIKMYSDRTDQGFLFKTHSETKHMHFCKYSEEEANNVHFLFKLIYHYLSNYSEEINPSWHRQAALFV